ncbi:MAG: hypothetical protein ACJ768_24585 [Gaiellaceae bacterium]|jgi:hypothetical protein
MRLSELVARCADRGDPVIALESPDGVPVDVREIDLGVMVAEDGSRGSYVLLTPYGEEG